MLDSLSLPWLMRLTADVWLQAEQFEERFLLNPGSATGAYSSITATPKPSFLLMDIDGPKVGFVRCWCGADLVLQCALDCVWHAGHAVRVRAESGR